LRKGLAKTIKFLAFFAVGLLLLWLAFRNVEYKRLVDGLKEADYRWIIPSLIFALLAYASRARRWELLIYSLGYKPTLINTFNALMSGYLANLALPRVGEITRCVALGKKEKIPVDQLIGTVVIERAIDILSLLTVLIIFVVLESSEINQFLNASIFIPLKEKVFSMFGFTWLTWVIIVVLIILVAALVVRYRKKLRQTRFFSKFFDISKGVVSGFRAITRLQNKWEFILHTIFIWVNYTLMTWVVVFSIGSTSHISLGGGIFLLVIGGLAMSAPVQSGLGAYHYIISRGIAFIAGVKIEDGLIYAFLTHESQMVLVIIVGTIATLLIFHNRQKEETGS
jgi:uncharacterized protein (TIRG00374 family)